MPQLEWFTKSPNGRASVRLPQGNVSWTRSAAFRWAGPIDPKKLRSWSHSWHRIELRQSREVNTSSTAEQSQPSKKENECISPRKSARRVAQTSEICIPQKSDCSITSNRVVDPLEKLLAYDSAKALLDVSSG